MRRFECFGVLGAFVTSAALAHHSPSAYDMAGDLVTVEGTLMKIDSDGSDAARTIHLDLAEHPANVEPSLFGHSIGHWEGATLVIDTVAFTPHRIGIGFGVPSGTRKHLIERLTLTADRLQLRYELTVEDPEYLTTPATYTALWDHRPDLTFGSACDQENSERFRDE